jgi:hypothetical protein
VRELLGRGWKDILYRVYRKFLTSGGARNAHRNDDSPFEGAFHSK